MSDRCIKRLQKEWILIQKGEAESLEKHDHRDIPHLLKTIGWIMNPVQHADGSVPNMKQWEGIMMGPEDSPFSGLQFRVRMTFGDDYPAKPPLVIFADIPFHPNIYETGHLCLDILADKWVVALQITSVMHSIRSLLNDPNIDSPANPTAAAMYRDHREEYNAQAQQFYKREK